jgi:hypothetical protein
MVASSKVRSQEASTNRHRRDRQGARKDMHGTAVFLTTRRWMGRESFRRTTISLSTRKGGESGALHTSKPKRSQNNERRVENGHDTGKECETEGTGMEMHMHKSVIGYVQYNRARGYEQVIINKK